MSIIGNRDINIDKKVLYTCIGVCGHMWVGQVFVSVGEYSIEPK